MLGSEQSARDLEDLSIPPPPLSRRNLPRASHACEWCRVKKAKCDQQQPCANCIKHSNDCIYENRRRHGRRKRLHAPSPIYHETSDSRNHSLVSVSPRDRHGIAAQSEDLAENNESAHSGSTHPPLPVYDSDAVGEVNQHTHGTEFYGSSSNFVLLNQLFAYARENLPPGHSRSNSRNENSYLSPSSAGGNEQFNFASENDAWKTDQHIGRADLQTSLTPGRISIVNLLSNEEALSPPSRPKTPPPPVEKLQSGTMGDSIQPDKEDSENQNDILRGNRLISGSKNSQSQQKSTPVSFITTENARSPENAIELAQRRLEREYAHIFMTNLHHIHPMLDPVSFKAQCEEKIWFKKPPVKLNREHKHFFALYNIVVAVGALIAGSAMVQDFSQDIEVCMAQSQGAPRRASSQALSRDYFRKSRAFLGDIFEVCSLESAQTLLLMSLYCQNSLKPHACYMYCGQAVRTALAIGLASESLSGSVESRRAARRTWWCIYSHEIDMSCSSGRRDSLGKPHNYQVPLPRIRDQEALGNSTLDMEKKNVAMINEMVQFAAVLRSISKKLYHDSKGLTILQKSVVAMELNTLLDGWEARLPAWLDFKKISFREEEWAAKQKVVLRLRYLNARILLHRPFLAASKIGGSPEMPRHVELCLAAARETIGILYDSYANRHYFRTWWYNSTYTLYAGMIVLYVIMLGNTPDYSNDLLSDVTKSRDILESMEEVTVARRSADLIREVLEIAQACVQFRQNRSNWLEESHLEPSEGFSGPVDLSNMTANADNDFARTLLLNAVPGHDPGSLFASLIDPNLLQDFTAGNINIQGSEFPNFFGNSFAGDESEYDMSSRTRWQQDGSFEQL